jgi:hypothetical protein
MHLVAKILYSFPINPDEYDSDTCDVVAEVDFEDGEACNPRIYAAQYSYGSAVDMDSLSGRHLVMWMEESVLDCAMALYHGQELSHA